MKKLNLEEIGVKELNMQAKKENFGGWFLGLGPLRWNPMIRAGMLSRSVVMNGSHLYA